MQWAHTARTSRRLCGSCRSYEPCNNSEGIRSCAKFLGLKLGVSGNGIRTPLQGNLKGEHHYYPVDLDGFRGTLVFSALCSDKWLNTRDWFSGWMWLSVPNSFSRARPLQERKVKHPSFLELPRKDWKHTEKPGKTTFISLGISMRVQRMADCSALGDATPGSGSHDCLLRTKHQVIGTAPWAQNWMMGTSAGKQCI